MQIIYKTRNFALLQDGSNYIVTTDYDSLVKAGQASLSNKHIYFTNPIEAWNKYWNDVDSYARRGIGDMLEKEGRNRYTGEAKESVR